MPQTLANWGIIVLGVCIRTLLFNYSFYDTLSNRIEVVSPVSSHKRVLEGLFLFENSGDPYQGTVFHQAPLLLAIFKPFQNLPLLYTQLLFILLDVIAAHSLFDIARTYKGDNAKPNSNTPPQQVWFNKFPYALTAMYMLHPFAIVTCVGMSTIAFTNIAIVLSIKFALKGNPTLAAFFVAVAAYLSLYPIVLVLPLVYLLQQNYRSGVIKMFAVTFGLFVFSISGLLYLSYTMLGSWTFLRETYGFTLFVEELTPNIGLFWYFFVEVFDYFQNYFLFVLQYNAFIYGIPLTMRLKHHPFFLFWVLVAISSAFKPYPVLGDVLLPGILLPLFHDILHEMQYPVVVGVGLLVSSTLAPVLWHMWIYQGGGNANFFYAITLVFALCQVLLITDATTAVLKKDYLKKHNITPNN